MELIDSSATFFTIFSLRFFIGLFFVTSALRKLFHLAEFMRGVVAYQFLPENAAKLLGVCVPFVEGGVGLLILLGIALSPTSIVAFGLVLLFTTAVIINLRRGHLVKCNCYGLASTQTISTGTVARNIVLMTFCLFLFIYSTANPQDVSAKAEFGSFSDLTVLTLLMLEVGFAFLATYLVEWMVDINGCIKGLSR